MSRIGKKVIPLPAGVKYKVEGNTVLVEGPKGKVSALIAQGISLEAKDGALHVVSNTCPLNDGPHRSGDEKQHVRDRVTEFIYGRNGIHESDRESCPPTAT